MNSTIEIVSFKLKQGQEAAFTILQDELNQFIKAQKGFYYRTLVQDTDGQYMDIVHWASEEDAKAAGDQFMQQPFGTKMMELIEQESVNMRHIQALTEVAHDGETEDAA